MAFIVGISEVFYAEEGKNLTTPCFKDFGFAEQCHQRLSAVRFLLYLGDPVIEKSAPRKNRYCKFEPGYDPHSSAPSAASHASLTASSATSVPPCFKGFGF